MRREIKFRGKAISGPDKGKWYYGFYWTNGMGNHIIRVTKDDNGFCIYDVEVDPETVGEYIGQNDKNGKEIYSGDIVRDINTGNIRYVIYNNSSFVLKDERGYFYWTYFADEYVVIGTYTIIPNC